VGATGRPGDLSGRPQVLFVEEDLEQARRQLVLYGRDGLPVSSRDGQLRGWLNRADALPALATDRPSGSIVAAVTQGREIHALPPRPVRRVHLATRAAARRRPSPLPRAIGSQRAAFVA
jgi:CBS domain-containing protein